MAEIHWSEAVVDEIMRRAQQSYAGYDALGYQAQAALDEAFANGMVAALEVAHEQGLLIQP